MFFEFVPGPGFDFLTSFGEQLGVPVTNNSLKIPASLGEGSIRRLELDPDFKAIIHHYTFREEFVLKRCSVPTPTGLASIIFNSNEEPVSSTTDGTNKFQFSKNSDFAIQISSTDLDSVIHFPANTEIFFTVIGIRVHRLQKLLDLEKPNSIIETITSGAGGFLYHERMGLDIQKVLRQLINANAQHPLSKFYHMIRIEELLYLLFDKILKRENVRHSTLYKADIEKLYLIRTAVLADLSTPPRLPELAKMAGFSETRMKDLFRQVFGDSIYNYYQKARMEEAAFLLKQGGLSVADAGYELGFNNMSHFSRVFEKHWGLKPKKYSSGG